IRGVAAAARVRRKPAGALVRVARKRTHDDSNRRAGLDQPEARNRHLEPRVRGRRTRTDPHAQPDRQPIWKFRPLPGDMPEFDIEAIAMIGHTIVPGSASLRSSESPTPSTWS